MSDRESARAAHMAYGDGIAAVLALILASIGVCCIGYGYSAKRQSSTLVSDQEKRVQHPLYYGYVVGGSLGCACALIVLIIVLLRAASNRGSTSPA